MIELKSTSASGLVFEIGYVIWITMMTFCWLINFSHQYALIPIVSWKNIVLSWEHILTRKYFVTSKVVYYKKNNPIRITHFMQRKTNVLLSQQYEKLFSSFYS